MITFGPIPSRRLGSSLGINNIPGKHCSYACMYCQAGPTPRTETTRRLFFEPSEIFGAVSRRVYDCRAQGLAIDFLSFVPDGEPTLDINLGASIALVKTLGIPVAVITNGSLLWDSSVRADLQEADLVSVEIDTTSEAAWRAIDRPTPELRLERVLAGIEKFASEYTGELMTQTMLVSGVNDAPEQIANTASFVRRLQPRRAFLAIPTRPPADARSTPPDHESLQRAYAIMSQEIPTLELLTESGQGTFGRTGNAVEDLLATLKVHPMRLEEVKRFLIDGAAPATLEQLVASGEVREVEYRGVRFVVRNLEPAACGAI